MPYTATLLISRIAQFRPLVLARSALAIAAGFALMALPELKAATGALFGDAADAQINNSGGVSTVTNITSSYNYIGGGTGPQMCVVYVFPIPAALIASGEEITAANLSVKLGLGSSMAINADLYGVGFSSSPAVSSSYFYMGSLDVSNRLIQDNLIVPSTPAYSAVVSSGSALVDYLNDVLYSVRSAGLTSAYVFLRISPDGYSYGNRYVIAMTEAGGAAAPKLEYTSAAVSAWDQVPLGGGGYVTGLVSDRSGNDIYCRTDVGGAFRWDAANGEWIPIADQVVPYNTPGAEDTMSIPSLAVDPSNSNQLYMAVGGATYATLHGIFSSSDKGAAWTQINSSIIMEGNGGGRPYGERLVVDPNNPNILWFGSIQEGLFKGAKSGSTWTWTQIPSTSVPFGTSKIGVPFVICDKNGSSTITYAGVYDAGGAGGVYSTTDGTNWSKVGGAAILQPGRAAIADDGALYVAGRGTVVKMPRGGSLSAITPGPANISYLGITVSPSNSSLVFAAESSANGASYGKIWRSANGGATWSQQVQNLNGGNLSRTEPDGTPTLTGYWFGATSSLLVNPANPNELWAGDFFGVARTQDAQNLGTSGGCTWRMLQKNQEETVVQTLKNAPAGHKLILGVSDVGGARYNNTGMRPYGAYGNIFGNPRGGSTTSLDFSESIPNVWARGWVNGPATTGTGAVSNDGGASWMVFGQLARKTITNAPAAGTETFDLGAYIGQQRAKGITIVTLVMVAGDNPSYSTSALTFDSINSANTALHPKLILNGSIALSATADTYVSGGAPTTNYGAAASFGVSHAYGIEAHSKWAFLQFDLSSVASVTSAALQLNRQASTNTLAYPVGIFAIGSSSWTESGVTWSNRPIPLCGANPMGDPRYYDGATALWGGRVAVSATNPDHMVWLSLGAGVAARYSRDRGVTWTGSTGAGMPTSQMISNFNPSTILNQLASDRVNGNFYLARFGGTAHAIYRSADGGATWSSVGSVNANTYNVYRCQLVAAPLANHLWLSDDGVSGATAGGVWRSTDGGATWTKAAGVAAVKQVSFGKGSTASNYSVFVHGYRSGVKGIYRSDDYGATWTALASPPSNIGITCIAGDRQNIGKVYIGTGGRGAFAGQ